MEIYENIYLAYLSFQIELIHDLKISLNVRCDDIPNCQILIARPNLPLLVEDVLRIDLTNG